MSESRVVAGNSRLRALVRRVRDPHRLPDRVYQLEMDVLECRSLNVRVAELTDLVSQLLVELARLDPERAAEIIAAYQDELGG